MRQRVSLITLGVDDLQRSRRFYEAMGWEPGPGGGDDIVFFQAGDMLLALWDRAKLAADSCVEDTGGWGGITLAHCVRSAREVDQLTERARSAGADVRRAPADTFWGGYSSIILDLDGHVWEIAHNPNWTVTEGGAVRLR